MHRRLPLGWASFSVASTALVLISQPQAVLAQQSSCAGTWLQLSVVEQGKTAVDRFRFSLALSGEGSSERAALNQLNQRLGRLRQSLQPLIQGRLLVSPPSTYPRPGSHGAQQFFVANTGVSGEVNRQMYNRLIQSVGGQSGVWMQGMESIANEQAELMLQQRLVAAALRRGKTEADDTAAAIGASRVRLLRINRSDAIRGPRRVQLSGAMRSGFDPGEAPEPTASVRMELHYCLS